MQTLNDLFLDELADMYDAEHRILKALPKMIKTATCEDLKKGLTNHLAETEGQITKLEEVFAAFGEKAKGKKCEATVGLLKEGDEIMSENKGSPTINSAIISAGQKVEHYEIASYTCLREWAKTLGNKKAVSLIDEILAQEKNADKLLGSLAPQNNDAAMQAESEEEQEPASSPKSRGSRSKQPSLATK